MPAVLTAVCMSLSLRVWRWCAIIGRFANAVQDEGDASWVGEQAPLSGEQVERL